MGVIDPVSGDVYLYKPYRTGAAHDTTAPAIQSQLSGTLGSGGFYTSNVTVTWAVTDGESTISNRTGCDAVTISSDTDGQTLTCNATSEGGTSTQSVTIKRDGTAPEASAAATSMPNANGWYRSNVTVRFSGTDATSGIASCSGNVTLAAEGSAQSSPAGNCTDMAGNVSAPVKADGINIDKTAPTVVGASTPAANGAGWNNSAVTVTFSAMDATSGVDAAACGAPVTLSGDGFGQSATGVCEDRAGNVGSATVSGINLDTLAPHAGHRLLALRPTRTAGTAPASRYRSPERTACRVPDLQAAPPRHSLPPRAPVFSVPAPAVTSPEIPAMSWRL